jgi:hypothetical protein
MAKRLASVKQFKALKEVGASKHIIDMDERNAISIVSWSDHDFSVACMHKGIDGHWSIDESHVEPTELGSKMEVYGFIQDVIQPAYYEYTGFEKL